MIFIISLGLAFRENFIIVLRKAFVDKEPNGYEEKSASVKEVRARQIPKIERKKPKADEIKEEELIDAQVLNDDESNLDSELDSEPEPEMELAQESRPATISGVEILNEVAENKKLLDQIERGKVEKPKDFVLPPLKFLNDPPKRSHNINEAEIDQQISNLLDKLRKFKIDGDVVRTYTGPIVTTFEFRPAPHIKVSKILTLQDDLAMALKAQTIRIQAPIPGKDVVGIEVPNQNLETIYLKEILESEVFKNASSPLTMALGKDIVGAPFVTDLKKLPHLLIAGTTGSGKSVGINAMLLSLLYRNSPQTLRLMMIDPKMLEFSIYNDIPHLLTPVITEAKKAITALSNMVAEMERRYKIMSQTRTKNIESYNEKMKSEGGEQFPYIVVIIDELADLMMVVGKKIEELIARLAQKARAAGIHLVLATQRPSVDVITGLIKANIPSRIAFQVSSKIDSRTILDQMGAETLLGQGDMLYLPAGTNLPQRVHGAYVADDEVHKVVTSWREVGGEPDYIEGILEGGVPEETNTGSAVGFGGLSSTLAEAGMDGESDPMYDQAVAIVLQHRRASISLVQRHLRIGYNRAARLLEQMERSGIVSPMTSNGNRDILVPVNGGRGEAEG